MKNCANCDALISDTAEECWQCQRQNRTLSNPYVGRLIAGKYLIEEKLGTGGMCDVYRARHTVIGKAVALKILKPELAVNQQLADRFAQEARAVSRFHHPNVVSVLDVGVAEDGAHYLVLELIEGISLRDLLQRSGPLSVLRTGGILRQVCGALEAAHEAGVVHRDIKPGNIIIADYEGADWVKVVDFGVSKILEDANLRAVETGANYILGTPRYMSPEQCDGRPVDERTDIYSLGVVLYEMLCGRPPFDDASATRLMIRHSAEQPPPLRQCRPDLPPAVEAVVMQALAKDPAQRFQHVAELIDAYESITRPRKAESRLSQPTLDESHFQAGPAVGERFHAATPQTADLDEPTLVRPHPAHRTPPRAGAANTHPASSATVHRTHPGTHPDTHPGTHPERAGRASRLMLPLALIGALLLGGLVVYLALGRRLLQPQASNQPATLPADPAAVEAAAVPLLQAQAAIGGAIAQLQALPQGHPLRDQMPQLIDWQNELKRYRDSKRPNPDAPARAEAYRARAAQLTEQAQLARAELAQRPSAPATTVPPAATEPAPPSAADPATATSPANARAEVTGALNGWLAAQRARDLNRQMEYYADALHTYYLQRGVPKVQVRTDKERAYRRYRTMDLQIKNLEVEVEPSGERAVATFDKTWNFEGTPPSGGVVRERVWLTKVNGQWRITGERDLQVLARFD